jgi:quinol monooxygenase YgiN
MVEFKMKISAVPEKREEFLQTIRLLSPETRNLSGCLSHDWYEDLEESNTFVLLEHWSSMKTLNRYHRSEHFRVLLGAAHTLGKLLGTHCFSLSKLETRPSSANPGDQGLCRL